MRILPENLTTTRLHSYFIRALTSLLLLSLSAGAVAAPTAYTDEAEFHNALALLGYTATHEGFEDDAAWGGVRSFITSGFKTASSISNLGMTWTSNYVAGNITTGEGPARSGLYGFYSYLHGSYSKAKVKQPSNLLDDSASQEPRFTDTRMTAILPTVRIF